MTERLVNTDNKDRMYINGTAIDTSQADYYQTFNQALVDIANASPPTIDWDDFNLVYEATVVVSAGIWVALCPFCEGAIPAGSSDPDVGGFFCPDCLMAETSGKPIATNWPTGDDKADVEELLLYRPLALRNYGQKITTVNDLDTENGDLGYPQL